MDYEANEILNEVMIAYVRVGRGKDENALAQAKVLVSDIKRKGYTSSQVKKALERHAEKSRFAPTLADIIENLNEPDPNAEADFMLRFARQAMNPYSFYEIDEDVYSVRESMGKLIHKDISETAYQRLMPKILEHYRQYTKGKIKSLSPPNKHAVKIGGQ